MARDWSMLPSDILATVAEKLVTLEDITYFSAVCRGWNGVRPLVNTNWKPIMPWLLLAENTKDNPTHVRKLFTLSHTKCYNLKLPETFGARCWGSPYGWVAMIDIDLNILLFDPMTKARLTFPHWKTLQVLPSLDRLKCEGDEAFSLWFSQEFTSKLFVLKVQHENDRYEFVIVMIYREKTQVVLARPGDVSWTPVSLPNGTSWRRPDIILILDIICIDDNAYALYDDGSIRYWNLKETRSHPLIEPKPYFPCKNHATGDFIERIGDTAAYGMRKFNDFIRRIDDDDAYGLGKLYLVRSGTDLLMVIRYKNLTLDYPVDEDGCFIVGDYGSGNEYGNDYYRTMNFSVLKFVDIDKGWEQVQDLGDVALFVGNNNSMSISTKGTNYLRRGCIYFTDDENDFWNSSTELGGHDMGVYDLTTAQFLPQYKCDIIPSFFSVATFFTPRPYFSPNTSIC